MVTKKTSGGVASNISSGAAPATAAAAQSASRSSIIRSAFSPSIYQLSLFASVIQGLESQHLRIHDTVTGRLRCEHASAPNSTINSLDWGYYGGKGSDWDHQLLKKKRKRGSEADGSTIGGIVVAFGTNNNEIVFFSPVEGKVVGKLQGVHSQGIRDFKFTNRAATAEGWSLGGEGKLAQWDLRKGTTIRVLTIGTNTAITLSRPVPTAPSVICASHVAYVINQDTIGREPTPTFKASTTPIHAIITSSPSSSKISGAFLTSSDSDRFLNLFDVEGQKLIGSLNTESEVQSVNLYSESSIGNEEEEDDLLDGQERQALAVVNRDGLVEIFPNPFQSFRELRTSGSSSNMKSKRRQMTKKSEASVKITRPDDKATLVPVINAAFQKNDLIVAWSDGGVNISFERIRWQDDITGALVFKGLKEIVRGKSTGIGAGAVMNGVKDMGNSNVNESRAVVVDGIGAGDVEMADQEREIIAISSDEEESEYESSGDEEAQEAAKDALTGSNEDAEMKDVQLSSKDEDFAEPSFGDLVRANASEPIDVEGTFEDPYAQTRSAIPSTASRAVQLPSGTSLGTVLTQSLKTNDIALLETCLHTTDLATIRSTIERLDSSLAGVLLEKLSDRLHKRPGRAASLMVWAQWTLVSHGGYLASQPDLIRKLGSLNRVVKERSTGLQPLLSLKGKLDMLDAQMQLRKRMQASSRAARLEEKDDEEGVIYVEGQDDEGSEGSGSEAGFAEGRASESDDDGDDMPMTVNGVTANSDDDESDSEDDLVDDEAEDTDADTGDDISEDEVDHDDVDSMDEEESEDEAPRAKRPNAASSKRR
ncbi:MAG: hypothetical protein M1819_002191 [Sarea resinae]|nr:MAG: hypothetical protein M1819_002191 [Sarea resinae]